MLFLILLCLAAWEPASSAVTAAQSKDNILGLQGSPGHHGHEDDSHHERSPAPGHHGHVDESHHERSLEHEDGHKEPVDESHHETSLEHEDDHEEPVHHFDSGHLEDASSNTLQEVMALMLFGVVGWVVSMFYFVNWPDEDVQLATWSTLSQMISIFCAVLLFGATTGTLVDFVGFKVYHHGTPTFWMLLWSYVRWGALFIMLQTLELVFREKKKRMACLTNIGAHVVGFAAIDAFGTTLHVPLFAQSFLTSLLGVVLVICILLGLTLGTQKMRDFLGEKIAWSDTERKLQWQEDCADGDSESLGLTFGLFDSLLIRFLIIGHLPAIHGEPQHKTDFEVWMLFLASLLLAPCVMLASIFGDHLEDRGMSETVMWIVEVLKETCDMNMGWCLLYWGYWSYYLLTADEHGAGGRMGMRILMALLFSALVLVSILMIDFFADRVGNRRVEKGLRRLLKTFALLMGLSWEGTFAIGVESFANDYKGHTYTFVMLGSVTALCAFILPAWALYIFPKVYHHKIELGAGSPRSPRGHPDLIKHMGSPKPSPDLMQDVSA